MVKLELKRKEFKREIDLILESDMKLMSALQYLSKIIASNKKILTEKGPMEIKINYEDLLTTSNSDYRIETRPITSEYGGIQIRLKEVSFLPNNSKEKRDIRKLSFHKEMPKQIFQLKIAIKYIKPPIWRRILISNHANFHELHLAIQEFFNWGNYHLHEFQFLYDKNPNHKICLLGLDLDRNIPEDLDGNFLSNYKAQEDEVRLCNVFSKNRQTVKYLYDFGDNWEHSIQLEKVFPFKKGFKTPLCVGGKRAAPPEDCGGSWGYQDLLEILKNKHHPEHEEMKEWVGTTFNPEKMDVQIIIMTPRQIEEKYGPIIPI
ncbi:MAG: plasmid pRiA4b ORF-3 family protein [Promethearchaeota archaeon]